MSGPFPTFPEGRRKLWLHPIPGILLKTKNPNEKCKRNSHRLQHFCRALHILLFLGYHKEAIHLFHRILIIFKLISRTSILVMRWYCSLRIKRRAPDLLPLFYQESDRFRGGCGHKNMLEMLRNERFRSDWNFTQIWASNSSKQKSYNILKKG